MTQRGRAGQRAISPLLLPDDHRIFYHKRSLVLFQLYFLTGCLANYVGIVHINNAFAALCILMMFFSRSLRSASSPLIILYGTLTLLSLANHLIWQDQAGFPAEARTMPIILLLMMAARAFAVEGLFGRGVALNSIPFIALYAVGARFSDGRFQSVFLDENVHGGVLTFAAAIGLTAVSNQQYSILNLLTLGASATNILLGASRKLFLFLVLSLAIVASSVRSIKPWHILSIAILLGVSYFVIFPILHERQSVRFREDVSLQDMIERFIVGSDDMGKSSRERREFVELSFYAADQNWFGYGNGNFNYVVRTYGAPHLSEAGHPHAGIAEALITAGYPGGALYLVMLIYLSRIGWRDPVFRIILLWLFLQVFTETSLNNRIMWPLLALAEWELTKRNMAWWVR